MVEVNNLYDVYTSVPMLICRWNQNDGKPDDSSDIKRGDESGRACTAYSTP